MKTNYWLILGTVLATTAVAQVNTNPPAPLPAIPPPATAAPATPAPVVAPAETPSANAPEKKTVKKKKTSRKKSTAKAGEKATAETSLPPVTLVPGPATVAAETVNLRGQAGLKGEVVGHVKKGDTVTVLAEITLDKPKAGEPAQWAKIALPSDVKVWLDSKYLDSNNAVTVKKLNLRGGPGENFSVLGVIEKGTAVTPVTTKGDWTQIQPPASAFAFAAAGYLKQEAGMENNPPAQPPPTVAENVPPPTPTPVPPTTTTVAETQPLAPPATTPPPVTPETTPPATPAPVPATTPAETPGLLPQPTLAPEETDTNLPPPPPRIVTHEGSVRHSVSPVAPTYFELFDPDNDMAIDYLYTTSTNLNLARYDGMHITVKGQEALDPRWKDTPVLTIQEIHVLYKDQPKPRNTVPMGRVKP